VAKDWSTKELNLLKQNYLKLNKQKLLELFKPFNRSWLSIYRKAYRLDLRRPIYKEQVDRILKEKYSNTGLNTLLKEIRRILPSITDEALRARGQRLGLSRREFANLKSRKDVKLPKPSNKLAWFLGVLAGDGYVTPLKNKSNSYHVGLITISKEFATKFNRIGEKLFGIKPTWSSYKAYKLNSKWRNYYACRFLSKTLAEYFGNWYENSWPETLNSKFSWVIKDENYLANFLSGYFDSDGNIRKNYSRAYRIYIAIKKQETQIYIKNLFSKLDVKSVAYSNGLWINGFEKCTIAARYLKSCIPHKEKLLMELRNANNNTC
jgi:DNA-binding transcriptional regulator WhiA